MDTCVEEAISSCVYLRRRSNLINVLSLLSLLHARRDELRASFRCALKGKLVSVLN
jgi:hypothetical protein